MFGEKVKDVKRLSQRWLRGSASIFTFHFFAHWLGGKAGNRPISAEQFRRCREKTAQRWTLLCESFYSLTTVQELDMDLKFILDLLFESNVTFSKPGSKFAFVSISIVLPLMLMV